METVETLCRELEPVIGPKAEKLWQLFLAGDLKARRTAENMIRLLAAKHLGSSFSQQERVLLVPPEEKAARGTYPLARMLYNRRERGIFGLHEDEWPQHIAVFGRSGAGKTNVAFLLLSNLLAKRKPFLIFDWKRNYRDMLAAPKARDKLLVFTPGNALSPFHFNPLIPPPGTSPTTWLKKLIEVIAQSYYVGEGVMHLFQRALDAVYRDCGMYTGKPKRFPTFHQVKTWLDDHPARGRELNWMASTLRTVGSLCFGEFGQVVNVRHQVPLDELLKKNVILELDNLTQTDRNFLIESLLLWIHHFRLVEGNRETFKHAIFVEEAHNILLKSETGNESVMDKTLREIRELGESLIILDQMPSKISATALANCYTTITLNMKWKADVGIAANYALLAPEHKEFFGLLPVGEGIVKLQGRCPRAFHVRFPLVKIRKGKLTDSDVAEHMSRYSGYSRAIEPSLTESEAEGDIPAPVEKNETETEDLTAEEQGFLVDVAKHPYSGIVERDKRLRISRRRGNTLKNALVDKGMIEIIQIPLIDGHIKLADLTEEGRKAAIKNGTKPKRRPGKESLEHDYWKQRVAAHFAGKGFKVEVEKRIAEGVTVDLLASRGDTCVAIEIETGKSDAIGNIRKALGAGVTVLSVATRAEVAQSIATRVDELGADQQAEVRVQLARSMP